MAQFLNQPLPWDSTGKMIKCKAEPERPACKITAGHVVGHNGRQAWVNLYESDVALYRLHEEPDPEVLAPEETDEVRSAS